MDVSLKSTGCSLHEDKALILMADDTAKQDRTTNENDKTAIVECKLNILWGRYI